MASKKSDRRPFLKNGAALAGLAAGAAAVRSAGAQGLVPQSKQSLKDAIAQEVKDTYEGTPGPAPGQPFDAIYGVRSGYETTGRVGGSRRFPPWRKR